MSNLNYKAIYLIWTFFLITSNVISQNIFSPEVEKKASEYVANKNNKGLVIGIVNGNESDIKGFGVLSKKNQITPDENTIFEIGSVTNVFTTSLMMLESYSGKFTLGERIQEYVPAGVLVPNYQHLTCMEYSLPPDPDGYSFNNRIVSCQPDPTVPGVCISFCDLASHTSGLPSEPRGFFRKLFNKKGTYKNYTKEDLYKGLSKYTLNCPPGGCFNYSNVGMALLGNIVADANGSSYSDLLEASILRPLNMENTGVDLNRTQLKFLAQGHTKKGKYADHWHFAGMAPAGGLKSSASDMVKFLQANLSLGGDKLIVDALAQTHESQVEAGELVLERKTSMGYGWFVSNLNKENKTPVVWNTGSTGGFRMFIGFIKSTKRGVVILSNSANSVNEMGFDILEALNEEGIKKPTLLIGENK